MEKRGQGEVFKYIFVLIVGVLILIFFLKFGFEHIGIVNKMSSVEAVRAIDDNLDAFSISSNSDRTIDLGSKNKIIFDCGSINIEDDNPIRTSNLIFSPRALDGNKIYAWTRTWKYPFEVTNFFYLSNDKIRYYLVYDSNTESLVRSYVDKNNPESIPERFNVKIISKDKVSSSVEDNAKFVFFTNPNINPSKNIKVIEIGNNIKFYEDSIKEIEFLDNETLMGAIFAEDYNQYKCGYDKALERLKIISKLYHNKASKLKLKNPECGYSALISNLQFLIENNPNENIRLNLINNNNLAGEDCVEIF